MRSHEEMRSGYLAEVKEKAQELLDHLSRTNADPQIGAAVQAMLTELVERPHDLTQASFDPLRLAVRAMLKKHGVAPEGRELSSITLAELDDVSATADELHYWLPGPADTTDEAPGIWQPIESAPREFVVETKLDVPDIGPVIIRTGRCIKARDADGDELIVHWSQQEGFGEGRGDTPHWWDWEAEEPLDRTITGWRELTAEEHAEVYGETK